MRVLFYEPFTINIPHFGTCLELIIEHLKVGHEVFFLTCDEEFTACDVNKDHNLSFCYKCIDRCNAGLARVEKYGKITRLSVTDFAQVNSLALQHPRFSDIDSLKSYGIDGFYDLGYGVASSLISLLRDARPDTILHESLIRKLLESSIAAYNAVFAAIERHKIETVFVYNGRYGELRAALSAARKSEVDIYLHEAGSDLSKYFLTLNELLHNVPYLQNEIHQFWNQSTLSTTEKEKAAHDFYVDRRNGLIKSWVSFTKNQNDTLPERWNPKNKNIVVFNSSEDEFAAIGDNWRFTVYESQIDALRKISNDLAEHERTTIWVRLHPNLKNAPPKLLEPYLELKKQGIEIILPDELISSYRLMDSADKIVTFGSTIGIEAAYWGKVSIMIGVSLYKGFGSVHEPQSHTECLEMILDDELSPLSKEGAIKYGFFVGNFGTNYKYFKKTGIFTGELENWDFSSSNKWKLLNYLGEKHIISPKIQHKAYQLLIK